MLQSRMNTARMISVHDEAEDVRFVVPNVVCGRYNIPSIERDASDIAKTCVMKIRNFGEKEVSDHVFAEKCVSKEGTPYILLSIVDAFSFILNPAEMAVDEFNQRMEPPIARMPVPIQAAKMANEIERQYGPMGITTIIGEEPTELELKEALHLKQEFALALIRRTTSEVRVYGERAVSPQARAKAVKLYEKGLIQLPEWAQGGTGEQLKSQLSCSFCGAVVPKTLPVCSKCRGVFDWKRAVEGGFVKPSEVPPSKRAEAGLESGEDNVREIA